MNTFDMKLNPEAFQEILNRLKTQEIRLNDEKRRLIKPGDRIRFTCGDEVLEVAVINLTIASNFVELFEKVCPKLAGWSSDTTPEQAASDMRKYYSEDDEKKWGVLAIEIKLVE
ncbi:MAG: ASCH domain-containing protein [candidate division WWE3 bacterium]|nr:ASCH domain-containing protein [candidate division WWE3 bacterium]